MMYKKISFLSLFKQRRLQIGDRLRLFGGYSMPPEWLNGKEAYYGKVIKFIPGLYKKEDAVVQIDEELSFMGSRGKILVLTLRYKGANWKKSEIVHLHLFENIPQDDIWHNNDNWQKNHIESHASYRIVRGEFGV